MNVLLLAMQTSIASIADVDKNTDDCFLGKKRLPCGKFVDKNHIYGYKSIT